MLNQRLTLTLALSILFSCFIVNASTKKNDNQINFPGQHELGMRTRFQEVNDKLLGDAQALTTRVKLTSNFTLDDFLSNGNQQWQLLLEPNFVYAFNGGDYNSVTVKKYTSPIPDPDGFNWSKVYLGYTSDNDWQVTLGRQALAFDNERMIGAIEFWQTPQNFDAFKFDFNNQINWHVQYAYSTKVHRIFGQGSRSTIAKDDVRYGIVDQKSVNELGEHKLNAHLLNIEYKTEDNLSLSAYNYFVANKSQSKFSSNTFGVRLSDEFKPERLKYRYTAEFAIQKDVNHNPDDYQAWYSLLEASIQYKSHIFQLSQEILSEDNQQGFKTPLGTNHKFQGWADVFTGMQTGLKDQYMSYRGRIKKLRWRAVLHHFKNYSTSSNIGDELDIELAYRATRKWEFKLVYANYKTKDGLDDFPKASHDLATWFASVAYNI